jgi:lysozyme
MSRLRLALAVSCVLVVGACADRDLAAGDLLVEDGAGVEQAIHNVCPAGETTYGIDVSVYQGDIDWARVAGAGVQYAIIRVGDGMGHDSKFARNWQGAKDHGVVRGAYQFFRSDDDPIAQADLLLSVMGPLEPGDLPPVADVESTDGVDNATRAARLQRWLDHVEAALGVTPIIYSGGYFWQDNVGRDFSRYPLWHAGYTGGTCPSTVANQWPSWTFWQFGSTGRVAGISGNVDEDRFNGSLADLRRFAHRDTPARGWLDAAACDAGVSGWAQDEDDADAALDVHVAIDGGDVVVRADAHRDDLCAAIGSCNHGFHVDVPAAARDGADHVVVARVGDVVLEGSGLTFRCDPPPPVVDDAADDDVDDAAGDDADEAAGDDAGEVAGDDAGEAGVDEVRVIDVSPQGCAAAPPSALWGALSLLLRRRRRGRDRQ